MLAARARKKAVVADHQLVVRAGVRTLLESLEVQVVSEAVDGEDLVQTFILHRPDILVIDIAMPRKTGLQALAEIRRHSSAVIAIVISNLESAEAVNLAFDCGANAYLVKDFALPELQQALAATLGGDKYLSPRITAHVLQGARGQLGHGKVMLTPRQFEILRLIADGHTNKEAARELGISPKTVDFHRQEIMRRLDVHDVAGLTRHALRLGLITEQ